jgi:hypothetical protein
MYTKYMDARTKPAAMCWNEEGCFFMREEKVINIIT